MTHRAVSLLVDRTWTSGAARRSIPVVNRATRDAIGDVAHAERSDFDRALGAAEIGVPRMAQGLCFDRSTWHSLDI